MTRFHEDAAGLLAELDSAGIDTHDFGKLGSVPELGIDPPAFDYERAAPILIKWLPRVRDPGVKEVIVRSLTGQRAARGAGTLALIEEFRNAPLDEWSLKWAIGNALSTIPDAKADDLIELLRDQRHGLARQMLCEALRKTKDSRAPDVLIDLIPDPEVGGHAIHALRSYGPKSSLPYLERARPALEKVLSDPSSSGFAQRMAKESLKRLDAAS